MTTATKSPTTEAVGIDASIPIAYYIAASKDKELRRLLRAKARATAKVQESLKQEEEAELVILDYVRNTYPAQPAEVS